MSTLAIPSHPAATSAAELLLRGEQNAAQWRCDKWIPERFRVPEPATLEGFTPRNDSQRVGLEAARRWVDAALAGRAPMLVLIGPPGVGKSHLLYAAIRAVNMAGRVAPAHCWLDLADTLRESKRSVDGGTPQDIRDATYEAIREVKALRTARFLALDEIRPSSGTDFDPQELSRLMIKTYDTRCAVIATTQQRGDDLAALIGVAGADRLTTVEMTGESYRKAQRPAR